MTSSLAKACNDNLVTLERYRFPHEAHIALGLLESHGVGAYVADEHIISANWLNAQAVGDVKLQVLETDFSQAQEILSLSPDEAEETQSTCFSCQSKRLVREQPFFLVPLFILTILISNWLAVFLFPLIRRKRCPDCGHLRN